MTQLHVVIERERRISCRDCVLLVPEVFDLDDRDAKLNLFDSHPDNSLTEALDQAAQDWPTK